MTSPIVEDTLAMLREQAAETGTIGVLFSGVIDGAPRPLLEVHAKRCTHGHWHGFLITGGDVRSRESRSWSQEKHEEALTAIIETLFAAVATNPCDLNVYDARRRCTWSVVEHGADAPLAFNARGGDA